MRSPILKLNNDVEMPVLGLGVYQSGPEETIAAVTAALEEGYRLIDTAAAYMNEKQVGEAMRSSGIDRAEVFVTTKLWMSDYGYEKTLHAFNRSLRKLGLEYVDLYLLHWPVPKEFDRTIESWRAAEKLLSEGRVRAIGVSNFEPRHLEDLTARAEVVPAVNQVELHPLFAQSALRAADARHGIVTQAWSPIGGVKRYWGDKAPSGDPLNHPVVTRLARKYGKTPAQVVLRWHVELGNSAIPKSVKAERIRENADIFDFVLQPDEVEAITALDTGQRGGPDPEHVEPQMFSFEIPD
jgi:diketogulonate reductase-like aldo/keto reductase